MIENFIKTMRGRKKNLLEKIIESLRQLESYLLYIVRIKYIIGFLRKIRADLHS